MTKCGYPSCPVEIASGGENPPVFCEKHMAVKCVYPPCQETTIPNSGFCQVHNDMTNFFDWIHGVRHMEAARQQAMARQNQSILQKIQGNGHDGRPIVRKP